MINLKQIRLAGFKSFPDKTTITMSDGVTCIVGPNGCGKSNVADAIRWVFGEQSAKTMRGTQMADVIFNGTEKRRRQSYCEVTLVFDNSRRIFDVEADEVEMTRRLYRDGESEYLLNKQQTRMKVITALLHGAGAAKEGYSIISQGRISQIMDSKPEARRSVFEEATGIVVFKDRKQEAENKLSLAKDNLRIFQGELDGVERQLTPLARQAENARKYKELHSQLRFHEINTFIYKTENAETEREKYAGEVRTATARREEIKTRMDEIARQEGELSDFISSADDKLSSLNTKRLEYSVGAERTNAQANIFVEKANSVKDKLNAARDGITSYTVQISAMDANIKREENYYKINSGKVDTLTFTVQRLRDELDELSGEISKYEYETGENRKRVMDTFRELSVLRENKGSLGAQKDLLEERVEELRSEMADIVNERDELQKKYDELIVKQEKYSALVGDEDRLIDEAEKIAASADEKLSTLVTDTVESQSKLDSLTSQFEIVSALRDKFEGYVYSVRSLMTCARTDEWVSGKIAGLIADVVSCDEKYETAVETAFGGAMQNVITETRDDARDLIQYLKDKRLGRVTFLPIDAYRPIFEGDQIKLAKREKGVVGFAIELVKYDKKFDNVIHNLLGNTLVCDDIDTANEISKAFPHAFKIVTLDGDLISTSGSMTGGYKTGSASNLLANERTLKELEKQMGELREFIEKSAVKKQVLEESRSKALENLDDVRNRVGDAKRELAVLNERETALIKQINDADTKQKGYEISIGQLEERLGELGTKYSDAEAGASELGVATENASKAITGMSGRYDELCRKRDEKTEDLNQKNLEIATLSSSMENEKDNVAYYQSEKEKLVEKMNELEMSIPKLTEDFDNFTLQATRATLSEEEQAALDEVINDIQKTEAEKKQYNEKRAALEQERRGCYDESERLSDSVTANEKALQHINDELENLGTRIADEYGETYESCKGEKQEDYDIESSAGIISSLRRQQSALGPVNLESIEEFEELNARHSEMLVQKEDLSKAIDDLTNALDDICTEMLRIFNEGFKTINENFKRTFKELFGGGTASLELDYEEGQDPLEAGVEINACPPGKKLSRLSLLSGGEQALTAIAILFAIIQMRPMPFCLLDEIEAALDDANVGRYANYLKKFSESTQFIVITHRKPTMEVADTLFGVTMEEKGISKIVSVKLSEVESRLGGDTVQ